ncbi:hypothetical protein FQA47_016422 [Oryzias melastigma]|uniref:Uncharacterized protein n=1 Tax=Oryzias melastigma TaxID=30732 RepID=A0A834FB41_ORYME|nr:hypothetical protein FQA47_016422 [Oryzias melastigma]
MSSLETFQSQLCSVMESLSGAAMAELGRLLKQSSADVWTGPAVDPVMVAGREGERDRQQLVQKITDWFASFMEAWTKDAVASILKMLKSSECQVSPAEQSKRLKIRTKPRSKTVKGSVASRRSYCNDISTIQNSVCLCRFCQHSSDGPNFGRASSLLYKPSVEGWPMVDAI